MDEPARSRDARYVAAGGRRLDCRVLGDGAPSLVFLHEGLGSVDLWRGYPSATVDESGETAIVYSRYGHGWSDVQREPRPLDFMDTEAFDVLPDLIAGEGVVDPILIGHSDGASIALLYASRYPVAGLILMAPHVWVEGDSLGGIADIRRQFAEGDLAERMGKYHRDPRATFSAWADLWTSEAFRPWNIEHCLADVRCPVLLIQGKDDEYGGHDQVDAIARQLGGPADRLDLDWCRHSPHLDRPATTTSATVGFIADLRASQEED